jgi:hypothetical protein
MTPFPYTRLGNYRILYVEPNNRIWVSQGYTVFSSDDLGDTFQPRASYPASGLYQIAGRVPLANRVLRMGFLGLLPLSDRGLVGAVRSKLLYCSANAERFSSVLERPGRTFKLEQTPDGYLYAGEYFSNPRREPVHVFRSEDNGRTWSVAYTFTARSIRHIHALTYDPIRAGLLILTGDLDHECQVLLTTNHFRTIQVLAQGSQKARAVGIVPRLDGFYLPTDTPFEQNYIQFLSNEGEIYPLCPIAGSCLAVTRVNDWAFFGTAVEPSQVNHDSNAALYGTRDGVKWYVIDRWCADVWSHPAGLGTTWFQMARVLLPGGDNQTGFLFATTMAVRGADGVLHRWQVGEI